MGPIHGMTQNNKLHFLDCVLHVKEGSWFGHWRLQETHPQRLVSDFWPQLEHKLLLEFCNIGLKWKQTQSQKTKKTDISGVLFVCGYPDWAVIEPSNFRTNQNAHTIYSCKVGRILNKHHITEAFKSKRPNTQTLVYAVQCSEEFQDLYIGKTNSQQTNCLPMFCSRSTGKYSYTLKWY